VKFLATQGLFALTIEANVCDNGGMEIIIPNEKVEKLTEVAIAAGFPDATALIDAIVDQPIEDPCGSLSENELRESAADCARLNEQMKAGTERDAREALTELGKKFGFKTPQ